MELQIILLVGAYQIIFLSNIPFFAAVSESVDLAKGLGFKWATGLVNASLRALVRAKKKLILEEEDCERYCQGNLVNCLSNLTSHPHWMVKRWKEQFDDRVTIKICINNNKRAPLTLRINTLKISPQRFLEVLKEKGIPFQRGNLFEETLILPGFRGAIRNIFGFSEGLFQVQGESSQIIGHLLSPKEGEKILDVCAGVGGKTTHLAQLSRDRAVIIATDTNKKRLSLLKENLKRLDINSVKVVNMENLEERVKGFSPFDKILIDAPCSGLGVIRRHPDIKWRRTPDSIKALSYKQFFLLKRWSKYLRPGGILVYSVCTVEWEETLGVINNFLAEEKGFKRVPCNALLKNLHQGLIKGDDLFILPGTFDMDGFYAAAIMKNP